MTRWEEKNDNKFISKAATKKRDSRPTWPIVVRDITNSAISRDYFRLCNNAGRNKKLITRFHGPRVEKGIREKILISQPESFVYSVRAIWEFCFQTSIAWLVRSYEKQWERNEFQAWLSFVSLLFAGRECWYSFHILSRRNRIFSLFLMSPEALSFD